MKTRSQPFSILRRTALQGAIALAGSTALLGGMATAHAQGQVPDGSVRILVGFPAGGTIDAVSRLIAERMADDLGVSVVVENQTGAGGQIAAQTLRRAEPDGRTLMVAPDHTVVILPETLKDPGYDVATDFAPVGMVADYAGGLAVHADSGITDVAGWIERARNQAVDVGVPAPGSKPVFAMDAFSREYGADISSIPYRGSAPLVTDLVAGHVDAGITALGDFLEHQEDGRLKVLAITGRERATALPDTPTATEQGFPMQLEFWLAMFAPAATPEPIIERLNASLNDALADPVVKERMDKIVFETAPSTPEFVREKVAAEAEYWAPLIEASGWEKQ